MTAPTIERKTGWMADASTLGARLALIRQRMAWGSVAEAARACNQPVESWRTWERDGVVPRRLTTVAKEISAATGCDYLWLVHGPDRGSGGGEGLNEHYRPIGERLIERRTQPKHRPNGGRLNDNRPASTVRPTQRRAVDVKPANRPELAAV